MQFYTPFRAAYAIFIQQYKRNLYWTSDVIFCLVYHLKSLHFSIILQMKHKTYFLSLFAAWETYQKFKNLNIVISKWKSIFSFERVLCTVNIQKILFLIIDEENTKEIMSVNEFVYLIQNHPDLYINFKFNFLTKYRSFILNCWRIRDVSQAICINHEKREVAEWMTWKIFVSRGQWVCILL